MFKAVLIVCTGNICRSPLAAALLAARAPGLRVASAGTQAPAGAPADPLSVASGQRRGVDLAAHRARRLDEALLAEHDLVLAAEQHHVEAVTARFPMARGRVFRLGHWRDLDVPDPVGRDEQAFEAAAGMIDACLADWLPHLVEGQHRHDASA